MEVLEAAKSPMSIAEVAKLLERKLKRRVSYETVRRDLLALSARGLINSKSIGRGKRVTWIFWAPLKPAAEEELEAIPDPFDISISQRDSMSPEEIAALYDVVVERCKSLIREAFGRGARYITICDGKVVSLGSKEPSDEEIRKLEETLGKVCYVLTEDMVEESSWISIGLEDYYPTIQVYIGGIGWREEEVFEHGLLITSDFDTGNPDIAAFSSEDVERVQPVEKMFIRRAFHLGRTYNYYLAPLKIGIKDSEGAMRCIHKTCRSVLFWSKTEKNPFLLANPKRKGFVGRDLMLKFPLCITLSGKTKQSKILLE